MKRLLLATLLLLGGTIPAEAHSQVQMFCFYQPNPNGAGGEGYVQLNGPGATSGASATLVTPNGLVFLNLTPVVINPGVQIHFDILPANNPTAPTMADRFLCTIAGSPSGFQEGNCGLHVFSHLPEPVVQCDQQFSR